MRQYNKRMICSNDRHGQKKDNNTQGKKQRNTERIIAEDKN